MLPLRLSNSHFHIFVADSVERYGTSDISFFVEIYADLVVSMQDQNSFKKGNYYFQRGVRKSMDFGSVASTWNFKVRILEIARKTGE